MSPHHGRAGRGVSHDILTESILQQNNLQTVTEGRLGWGEVTPLWFLAEERGTSGTRRRVLPQVTCHVMLCHVMSRYVMSCHVIMSYNIT